jgi:hypothetical protein
MYPKAEDRRHVGCDARSSWPIPAFAVVGVSDTGMWPDSPARTDVGLAELERFRKDLKRDLGLCSKADKKTFSEGNPFLHKRWVTVKPIDFGRASEYALKWLKEHEADTTLIHDADLEEAHASS